MSSRNGHDTSVEFISRTGLPPVPRPRVQPPELPEDLTILDDQTHMGYMQQYLEWETYLGWLLTDAKAEVESAERERRTVFDRKIIELTEAGEDKSTIAQRRASIDEDVVAADEAIERAKAFQRKIESYLNRMARNGSHLSRELTRRLERQPVKGRVDRYTP